MFETRADREGKANRAASALRAKRVFALIFWMGLVGTALPLGPAPREYEIKALFLLNFTRFVAWPPDAFPDAQAPLILGVLGEDPFGTTLGRRLEGKTVASRPLVVRRFDELDAAKRCHVLFISSSEASRATQILARLRGQPILTVGELPELLELGGVIRFFIKDNKVRFSINERAAEQARLRISSKLLNLARKDTN